jgi:aminomethyltransferase
MVQKTPLYDAHVNGGGKVVDFHGWALPVQFRGIIEEHLHTRSRASIFDCSHMGEFAVRGEAAMRHVDALVTSDIFSIKTRRARYGAILNEDGTFLDDIISFRMAEDELYIVTNAGPLAEVSPLLTAAEGVEDVSAATAKIDVQGPEARQVLEAIGLDEALALKYFQNCLTQWNGVEMIASRTGYTGELGYELFMPNELAVPLWEALLALENTAPAGLGARDTLRTEVGYALSGQDIGPHCTPLEAGMEGFVHWDGEFRGKAALEAKREEGTDLRFVGFVTDSRRAPRHDFELKHDGTPVGMVTSGTFGPSVQHGVGLGYVRKDFAEAGTQLTAGPRDLPVTIAEVPFYKDGTCRA